MVRTCRLILLVSSVLAYPTSHGQSLALRTTVFEGWGGDIVLGAFPGSKSADQVGSGWGLGASYKGIGGITFFGCEFGWEKQNWNQGFHLREPVIGSTADVEHQGSMRREFELLRFSPQLGVKATDRLCFMIGLDIGVVTRCTSRSTWNNLYTWPGFGHNPGGSWYSGEVHDTTYTGTGDINPAQFGLRGDVEWRAIGNAYVGMGFSHSFTEFQASSLWGWNERPTYFRMALGYFVWKRKKSAPPEAPLLKTPPDR